MFMRSLLIIFFIAPFWMQADHADLIVFSYNRPLQLYAFLESVTKYVTDIGSIFVVYRASNVNYAHAYEEVQHVYPEVHFMCQDNAARKSDFKPLVMHCLSRMTSDYCMFAVDDIVVKDHFSCARCIDLLEREGAYAFYLRLGSYVDSSYPDVRHSLPDSLRTIDDYIKWRFFDGECNWNCIHNLDLTMYARATVLADFSSLAFNCPNSLEGEWGAISSLPTDAYGLCFEESKMVNIPLNQVQECCHVPNMHYLNAAELLALFNRGMKLAIDPLYKIQNRSPHIDYVPNFIPRKSINED